MFGLEGDSGYKFDVYDVLINTTYMSYSLIDLCRLIWSLVNMMRAKMRMKKLMRSYTRNITSFLPHVFVLKHLVSVK